MSPILLYLRKNILITIIGIIAIAFAGCSADTSTTGSEGEVSDAVSDAAGDTTSGDTTGSSSDSSSTTEETTNDDDDNDDDGNNDFSLGAFVCNDSSKLKIRSLKLPYEGDAEGVMDSLPEHPTAFNGTYYFLYDNSDDKKTQLWRFINNDTAVEGVTGPTGMMTQGNTVTGFELVSKLSGGDEHSLAPIVFKNELYFVASDQSAGTQIWKTDGTNFVRFTGSQTGANPNGSDPADFRVLGNHLYFSAEDQGGDRRLWKTDGGDVGAEVALGPTSLDPFSIKSFGGKLYFGGNGLDEQNSPVGDELHVLDPSDNDKISVVKDINTSGNGIYRSSDRHRMAIISNKLYFIANDGSGTPTLFESDGSEAGTKAIEVGNRLDYTTSPPTVEYRDSTQNFLLNIPVSKGLTSTSTSLFYNRNGGDGNLAMYTPAAVTENLYNTSVAPTDVLNGGSFSIFKDDDGDLAVGLPGGTAVKLISVYIGHSNETPDDFELTIGSIGTTDTKHFMVSAALAEDYTDDDKDTDDRYILSASCR